MESLCVCWYGFWPCFRTEMDGVIKHLVCCLIFYFILLLFDPSEKKKSAADQYTQDMSLKVKSSGPLVCLDVSYILKVRLVIFRGHFVNG